MRQGLAHGGHHRGVLGHIHRNAMGLTAQLGAGFGQCLSVAVPQRDAGTRGQHALGNGVAQACGAAGDDRVAALHVKLIHR